MNEENKTRDISIIRSELIALLKEKKNLEEIKSMQRLNNQYSNEFKQKIDQEMINRDLKLQEGGRQKFISLFDKAAVIFIIFGLFTSSFFAIWLNSLI